MLRYITYILKISTMKTSPTMSNDEKCRFSLISVMLPSIQKRQSLKFFKIAMNHLHDYLDIRKIFKRFHLLDTLSFSLLTESPPLKSKILYEGVKSKFKEKSLLLNCQLDRINITAVCLLEKGIRTPDKNFPFETTFPKNWNLNENI